MSSRVQSRALLVGSLPADSAASAFRAGSEFFGDLLCALPDGETGARAAWVGFERERLVRNTPNVDTVAETESPTGIPRHAYDTPTFKIRDRSKGLSWPSWPRIDEALASYQIFRRLKDEGAFAPEMRFQVCLPFPSSALNAFKVDFRDDYAVAGPAFEDLVSRELTRLVAAVPASELAIQWDVCYEVLDLEGVITWMGGGDEAWQRFTGPVSRLTKLIPHDVLVGYHLCYGTFPDWPMYEARDLDLLVRMANFAIAHSDRQVDWVHIAGPKYLRSEDERFFSPLASLRPGDTRIFLGIVLPIDGLSGFKRRHATASKYLHDFGVAMYCGFGRQPGQDGMETMREHRSVLRSLP